MCYSRAEDLYRFELNRIGLYGIPPLSINADATGLYICRAVRMAEGPADLKGCTAARAPDGPGAPEQAEKNMIKGYTAKRNAAVSAAKSRTTTAKARPGRPKKSATSEVQPQPAPAQPMSQPFPLMIPEQLRTCLMAKEDVEAAVRKVFQEVQDRFEEKNNQRKVYLSEAMERLNVKSRSTMWHWHDKGFLIQEHDANGHVYYPEYKIKRAERGEHPEEGGDNEQ